MSSSIEQGSTALEQDFAESDAMMEAQSEEAADNVYATEEGGELATTVQGGPETFTVEPMDAVDGGETLGS